MIQFMFCLLEKCFFLGFEVVDTKKKIIMEEEEIYIRELGRMYDLV